MKFRIGEESILSALLYLINLTIPNLLVTVSHTTLFHINNAFYLISYISIVQNVLLIYDIQLLKELCSTLCYIINNFFNKSENTLY